MIGRDSVVWKILFYGGLVAIGIAEIPNPLEYGIPVSWMPYIKLLALVSTIVGGKLGLSWLDKGKI